MSWSNFHTGSKKLYQNLILGSLPQNFKFSFDDQTLPNALKAILAAPKTKKESIASTSANLLR